MSNAVAVSQHSESVKKRIQVLSEEVVTKIAAGEIIERPASVVRELLDNALDAGGDEITVAVEEGGRRLIRVIDNGQGMEREEVILAFQNHATSKIRSVEDLFSITTFGFRGEALASIASISRVEVKTRTHGAELGTRLIIEGGRIISVEAVSC